MKKIVVLLLLLSLLLPGAALPGLAEAGEEKLSVVTTIFAPYDFVRQVAGENAQVSMLLSPGSESHSFEPTPQDIIRIQDCDVFIHVGGENDLWVERILESMDTSKITILRLVDMVDTVDEEMVEGMEHPHEEHGEEHAGQEEAHGEEGAHEPGEAHVHEGELDEHVWTSPRNAMRIVGVIADTLSALDEGNAGTYAANAASYQDELAALDAALQDIVAMGRRRLLVFGDRFPFRYFADAYGLTYYAAFPGCSTDTEASAQTVAFLIDKVKEEQVPVVFTIELSTGRIAGAIAESTGAVRMEMGSAHNVSRDDFEAGITYLDIMWRNSEALEAALN